MKPILNNTTVNSALTATDSHHSKQIQLRAYELYEQRGQEHGHDVEDWLRAEAELSMRQGALPALESIAA